MRAEAIATVDGLLTIGSEGNHGVPTTLSTNCWMHLSGCSVGVSGTSLLALPSTPALGTPPRLVGITSGSKEFLLASGKGEFVPALHAGQGLV